MPQSQRLSVIPFAAIERPNARKPPGFPSGSSVA